MFEMSASDRALWVLSKWDQNAIRQGGGDRAYVLTGTCGETLRTSSPRLGAGEGGFVKRWLLRIVMAVELDGSTEVLVKPPREEGRCDAGGFRQQLGAE